MLVGLVAHHYLSRLGTSLNAEHRRGEKLALVSDVSGALTGPLPPAEIATKFLEKIRKVIPEGSSTAVDGQEALNLLESYTPDLVITDVNMPHIDGLESSRAIAPTTGIQDVMQHALTVRRVIPEAEGVAREALDHALL